VTWQPIETAPKDGTRILVCFQGDDVAIGQWSVLGGWYVDEWAEFMAPTVWMPLPAPPSA
jgi:hypothetical protein